MLSALRAFYSGYDDLRRRFPTNSELGDAIRRYDDEGQETALAAEATGGGAERLAPSGTTGSVMSRTGG